MDTSPSQQNKQPQQPPCHKKEQSQTTIDVYLKPIMKVRLGQNDIRNYFPTVAKTKVKPNGGFTKSNSLEKVRATAGPNHDHNGEIKYKMSGAKPNVKKPVENPRPIPARPEPNKKAPAIPVRPPNHKHANSAVLPKFDTFFDTKDFPHSTSPLAPRVTDVVRHSLVPRPLNIRMPPLPPPAEGSPSPSETTSSPSTVEDSDTVPLDEAEEHLQVPSFKQTYSHVHSHQDTTDDGPVSPLMALRDPYAGPWRNGMDRPAALRSKTMPQMSQPGCRDSVIYFLPKISPTSDESGDERTSLETTGYLREVKKGKEERADLWFEGASPAQREKKREEEKKKKEKEKDQTISPGMRPYIPPSG